MHLQRDIEQQESELAQLLQRLLEQPLEPVKQAIGDLGEQLQGVATSLAKGSKAQQALSLEHVDLAKQLRQIQSATQDLSTQVNAQPERTVQELAGLHQSALAALREQGNAATASADERERQHQAALARWQEWLTHRLAAVEQQVERAQANQAAATAGAVAELKAAIVSAQAEAALRDNANARLLTQSHADLVGRIRRLQHWLVATASLGLAAVVGVATGWAIRLPG